jgi:AcrR family transcriptional regulator
MFGNVDRRVRKTQSAIYSAFVSLIVERGYDAISVQQVIDEADVGRTTFYAHFKSKNDLLMFGFQRLRDDLQGLLNAASGSRSWSFLEPLLEHARAHLGLYRALLGGNGGPLAERAFQVIVEELVAGELKDEVHKGIDMAILAGALVGGIRSWIDKPAGASVVDVASTFRRFAAALERSQQGA